MLFNSLTFILLFLPLSILGFYAAGRWAGRRAAAGCLIVFSLIFYGWWDLSFVLLLTGSVLFNFACGALILRLTGNEGRQKAALIAGIFGNLLLLFHYKYMFALLHWLNEMGLHVDAGNDGVILPLGISFFTFTQIGYLIDCQAGIVKSNRFLDYALFVTFFPHLIAGPILHHKEIIPQFADPETYRFKSANLAVGLSLFIIGLFKKVVIADHFAPLANAAFVHAGSLPTLAAWGGVLSYALQLYFDFSGYSEMAVGLARLFGVRFPANFNSPYKATSIVDYWQRWHMTLTRYLTLYIYNPVALRITRARMAAGKPVSREAARSPGGFFSMILLPVFITMIPAGVWHGAGVQFLFYGLLHGTYLGINHAWRTWGPAWKPSFRPFVILSDIGKIGLTFLAVVIAQVFFRAASMTDAVAILMNMIGRKRALATPLDFSHDFVESLLRDCGYDINVWLAHIKFGAPLTLLLGYLIVWGLPNAMQIMARAEPSLSKIGPGLAVLEWRPNILWGCGLGVLAALAMLAITGTSEFLYFQF